MKAPGIYTPDELKAIFESDRPKYVSLITADGRQIIAKNNSQTKLSERFDQILYTLTSSSLKPGIYYYQQQNAIKGNPEIFKFPVKVGTDQINLAEVKPIQQPEIWTPAEALKILSENNRLQLENKFLQQQVDELTNKVADLENELSDAEALAEPAANPMAGLMELAIPLLSQLLTKNTENRRQDPGAPPPEAPARN